MIRIEIEWIEETIEGIEETTEGIEETIEEIEETIEEIEETIEEIEETIEEIIITVEDVMDIEEVMEIGTDQDRMIEIMIEMREVKEMKGRIHIIRERMILIRMVKKITIEERRRRANEGLRFKIFKKFAKRRKKEVG